MSVTNEQGIPRSRTRAERVVRFVIGSTGLAILAVGLHKLWVLPDRVSTLKWALGPVVIHDALVAPLVCMLGWAASRALAAWTRPAVLAGTVVTSTLFLVSLPVIGGHGATPTNPSLDPRNYGAGLLIALGVTWALVGLSLLWAAARRAR